jgi:hypothetical protein
LASNDIVNAIRSAGGPVQNDTAAFEGKLGEVRALTKIHKKNHALAVLNALERSHFVNIVALSITPSDGVNQELLKLLWQLDLPILVSLLDNTTIDTLNHLHVPIHDVSMTHFTLGRPITVNFVTIIDSIVVYCSNTLDL